MSTRLIFLSLALALIACGTPSPEAKGQAQPPLRGAGQVPFEFDGHIFFHALVNGDSTRLLYDPVDGLMLDRRFVLARPGMHRDWRAMGDGGPTRVRGAGAAEVEVTFADTVLLELGPIRRSFPRLPVIPLDSMMTGAIAGRADGLLGTGLLAGYALQLDFATRIAHFHDPATIDTTGWLVLHLEFDGAKAVTPITISVGDSIRHTLRAQVDLGMSPGFRVSTREVNARRLLRHSGLRRRYGRGLGGIISSVLWGNVTVHLGDMTTRPMTILLAREERGADADPPYDALLGLGVLSQFDVIYDPSNARMLLRQP
jgi:hypothetical protein